jgi:hypothetical protein
MLINFILLSFLLVGVILLARFHGPPIFLIKLLHAWQRAHIARTQGLEGFQHVREGTARIAERVEPETLRRLEELRARSDKASREFQAAFDEEAVRLGLKIELGEYGYLSNLLSRWAE